MDFLERQTAIPHLHQPRRFHADICQPVKTPASITVYSIYICSQHYQAQ